MVRIAKDLDESIEGEDVVLVEDMTPAQFRNWWGAGNLPPALQGARAKELLRTWRERYRLVLASGQGPLKDRIFRIGHLGAVYDGDVTTAVIALEAGLREHGLEVSEGAALSAARRALEAPEAAVPR